MLLKRLEISGFKSFAKTSTLEFPVAISAIVGPNGSGKSNVADSIRWVLGEQSMKSLRGKKGEDLIFGGGGSGTPSSPQVSRMGKASVSLVFDNLHKIFPYEFDEVIISRRVYRDGANEYLLNNSQARLKDVVELLSKVGLGASQHHIIGQGDADRILYASSLERKSMIEEALGLKIFELKKHEAERKLSQTEENIKNIESLRRELKPHLKYLEDQAKKSQNVTRLKDELLALTAEYIAQQTKTLDVESKRIDDAMLPLKNNVKELETEVFKSENSFNKDTGAESFFGELRKLDTAHGILQGRRRDLERQLGRMEAEARQGVKSPEGLSSQKVKSIIEDTIADLEFANRARTISEVREVILALIESLRESLNELSEAAEPSVIKNNDVELTKIRTAIVEIETEEKKILDSKRQIEEEYQTKSKISQQANALYRLKTDELATVRDKLRMLEYQKESLESRKNEFKIDFGEWISRIETNTSCEMFLSQLEHDTARKKIERLRIRIEEAGGVDENVLSEFEETQKRDEFLERELKDLEHAKTQVSEMFEELEKRIEKDFNDGLSKINILFGKFFQEIFGGGKAEIKLVKPEKNPAQNQDDIDGVTSFDEVDFVPEEQEPGIDIIVDIPRKRIKSLAMLSGGERALTSIALLFAMATANPPPFLVLDETDAALDEVNSSRYGSMLQALSKKTQLIVITHNRATMKVASVLYGVTMGGDGISKLLSIKFEDAEGVLAKK
ncbi:MAG: AAA family ATPase [Patescibacteria group bacterium]